MFLKYYLNTFEISKYSLELLEKKVNVCPVARHPVESLRVKSFSLDVGDGLGQENGHRVIAGSSEVLQGRLHLDAICF